MRILLLGDYSNFHSCLGSALAAMGHKVTVASDGGGYMNTAYNYSTRRPLPGKAGGLLLYAKLMSSRQLRGYDVVSLIAPSFVTLRPSRLRHLYSMLRRHNGSVFLQSAATDKAFMDYVTSPACALRYTEYNDGRGPINRALLAETSQWQQGDIARLCEEVYEDVDGITTLLYEYHLAMAARFPAERICYVGIPVDTAAIRPLEREVCQGEKLNFFLGYKKELEFFKGVDRIKNVVKRLTEEYPRKCGLTVVTNRPYDEYVRLMREGDIVLDQLYSFTPATNALIAMAAGQAVFSGAEPEYYGFIGEKELHPIINSAPYEEEVYKTLEECVLNPDKVRQAAAIGRDFVMKHNDSRVVAQRHLDFWQRRMR